jgi:hypothetical protein
VTELTAMEQAEARLTEKQRKELEWCHQGFIDGRVSEDELRAYLKHHLGWSSESAEEYVNAACDASDYAPQPPATPNAQLAPQEPVERRRPLLRPRYG